MHYWKNCGNGSLRAPVCLRTDIRAQIFPASSEYLYSNVPRHELDILTNRSPLRAGATNRRADPNPSGEHPKLYCFVLPASWWSASRAKQESETGRKRSGAERNVAQRSAAQRSAADDRDDLFCQPQEDS